MAKTQDGGEGRGGGDLGCAKFKMPIGHVSANVNYVVGQVHLPIDGGSVPGDGHFRRHR